MGETEKKKKKKNEWAAQRVNLSAPPLQPAVKSFVHLTYERISATRSGQPAEDGGFGGHFRHFRHFYQGRSGSDTRKRQRRQYWIRRLAGRGRCRKQKVMQRRLEGGSRIDLLIRPQGAYSSK